MEQVFEILEVFPGQLGTHSKYAPPVRPETRQVSDLDQKLICLPDGSHFVAGRGAILLDEDLLYAGPV
jgi:hypothetical protein